MDWPPEDGLELIRSPRFNQALIELAQECDTDDPYARVDAAALLYAGLEKRLALDPTYLDNFTSWEDLRVHLKGTLDAFVERSVERRARKARIWPLAAADLP